jgi:hypothetical protein
MSQALLANESPVSTGLPDRTAWRTLDAQQHHHLVDGKLTDDGIAAFHRDGFIAVDQIASAADVEKLKAILLRLHQTNVGFSEGAQFDAVGPDGDDPSQRRFPQILNPRSFAPEIAETTYHKVAMEVARQLLGDNARLKVDLSFFKPPHIGSDTAWHQDESFANPAFDHKDMTIWLAITEANAENSCMSYIPGSNNYSILPHRPQGGDPRAHALECIEGFNPADAVECPLKPGSCTMHTCRTLHYAGPNASDHYRLAYAMVFDLPPVLRKVPHDFPWRALQQTDRAEREKKFRRHGGILIHAWRDRHRISLSVVIDKLRRAFSKWNSKKL